MSAILLANKDFSEKPPRWTPLKYHPVQWRLWNDDIRFKIAIAGRRSGKTELAKRKAVMELMTIGKHGPKNIFLAAPVTRQAKRNYWDDVKRMVPYWAKKKTYESELIIITHAGAQLHVLGMDMPARVEGTPWDFGVLDEYANMQSEAWPLNIRPALSTLGRPGGCWFIGVPEGRNHFFKLRELIVQGELPKHEWALYEWMSEDILDPDEIDSAKASLDPLVYAQEYEGKFISFEGLIYYNFEPKLHFAQVEYDPLLPLIFCFDFNIAPGTCVIAQEQKLPNGERGTAVIDEIYIKRNSNTKKVCDALGRKYASTHVREIFCYGDPSGGSKRTSQSEGSDWDIVKRELRMLFDQNDIYMRVTNSKPTERARVNALNTRLLNGKKEVHMAINPELCKQTIIDFENVKAHKDGSGAIDKRSDPMISHLCFTGDTVVDTDKGMIRMDQLPKDGKVRTWNGDYVPYVEAGLTGKDKAVLELTLSDTTVIKCTPDHQLLTDRGWICAIDALGTTLINWKSELLTIPVRSSRDYAITGTMAIKDTLEELQTKVNNIFIELFGQQQMERYQREIISIIKMVIEQTIPSAILNAYQYQIIGPDTNLKNVGLLRQEYLQRKQDPRHQNGMVVSQVMNGINSSMSDIKTLCTEQLNLFAQYAEWLINQTKSTLENIAAINAQQKQGEMLKQTLLQKHANHAARNFMPQNIKSNAPVQNHAATVLGLKPLPNANVYCLRVPDHGCFALANGSIVSNSDGLSYYVEKEFPVRAGQLWSTVDV